MTYLLKVGHNKLLWETRKQHLESWKDSVTFLEGGAVVKMLMPNFASADTGVLGQSWHLLGAQCSCPSSLWRDKDVDPQWGDVFLGSRCRKFLGANQDKYSEWRCCDDFVKLFRFVKIFQSCSIAWKWFYKECCWFVFIKWCSRASCAKYC